MTETPMQSNEKIPKPTKRNLKRPRISNNRTAKSFLKATHTRQWMIRNASRRHAP